MAHLGRLSKRANSGGTASAMFILSFFLAREKVSVQPKHHLTSRWVNYSYFAALVTLNES